MKWLAYTWINVRSFCVPKTHNQFNHKRDNRKHHEVAETCGYGILKIKGRDMSVTAVIPA